MEVAVGKYIYPCHVPVSRSLWLDQLPGCHLQLSRSSVAWLPCVCCGAAPQTPLSLPVPEIFCLSAGISASVCRQLLAMHHFSGSLRALGLWHRFECHLLVLHLGHHFRTIPMAVLGLSFPQTDSLTVQKLTLPAVLFLSSLCMCTPFNHEN